MTTATLTLSKNQISTLSVDGPDPSSHLTRLFDGIIQIIGSKKECESMYKSFTLDAKTYFCGGFQTYEGEYVSFIRPVLVNVEDQGGYFVASIDELNIVVAEADYEEVKKSISDFLTCDYYEYALAQDTELTKKAIKLKRWFIKNTTRSIQAS